MNIVVVASDEVDLEWLGTRIESNTSVTVEHLPSRLELEQNSRI